MSLVALLALSVVQAVATLGIFVSQMKTLVIYCLLLSCVSEVEFDFLRVLVYSLGYVRTVSYLLFEVVTYFIDLPGCFSNTVGDREPHG